MKIKPFKSRSFVRKRLPLLLMRMLIFLFTTTVFSFSFNMSFSQEKVNIVKNQTVSIDEVFKIIQQQTHYHFIYPKKLFEGSPDVSLKKGEILVTELLSESLAKSDVDFEVTNQNTIVINKRKHQTVTQIQQEVTVTGIVTDANGIPIPSVNVHEKGTDNVVTTDYAGNFAITVSKKVAVLSFTFVGYETQELPIQRLSNLTNLKIKLAEAVNSLEGVVLTGYQTLSKERTAGSFDKIDEAELQQRPSPNFVDRINGKVSGLSVNPNSGALEIRGRGSIITANSNPLIVIDGFPMANQFNYESINPEDIESITVLKDAAASSVWGTKAANGVIVINTKKGKKNQKTKVDFSSFVEFEEKINMSDFNWMNSAQAIDLDQEFIAKNWVNFQTLIDSKASINDLHLAYIYRSGLSPDGITWSQKTFDNYINQLKQQNVYDDYEKYLLRNDLRKTYNLSVSGGGERNTFYGSLSYNDHESAAVGSDDDRLTLNVNNVLEFNDKIKFTAGVTTVLRNITRNSLTGPTVLTENPIAIVKMLQPYDQLIDKNGQYVQKYANWNPWVSQSRETLIGSKYTYNPIEQQRNLDSKASVFDVRTNFKLDAQLFKGITFSSSLNYERNTTNSDDYKNMTLPSQRNFINDYYINGAYQFPIGADYTQERTLVKGWLFRNNLTVDKKWNKHELNVFLASEYSKYVNEYLLNRQFGYDKKSLTYSPMENTLVSGINNFNGTRFTIPARNLFRVANSDNRVVSAISNMGYTYNGKYIINGSARIDQANIFGSDPDFRYKPLWSVALGWEIGKESFVKNAVWLNRLKLRASYGIGGNSTSASSPYAAASAVTNTYGGVPFNYLRFFQPENDQLKWEEVATQNLGLDFAFFNNRLSGSIDAYIRKSTDLLGSRQIDPTNGFESATINYASAENKGLELTLNSKIIQSKNFNWSLIANINYNKNKTLKYEGNEPSADALTGGIGIKEGKPLSYYYAYQFAGLTNNGEVQLYKADGSTVLWNDTSLTANDVKEIGSRVPVHYGGLSSIINYKGFDFTVNLNYQADFWILRSYNYASAAYGTANNITNQFGNIQIDKIWDQRWRQPGDEATTNVPKVFYNGINPTTGKAEASGNTSAMDRIWSLSDLNYHRGDYIRVQDIIFGYTMPSKFLEKSFFNNLRITFQVTNPFLWTANKVDADPTAIGREAYTNLTRFTLGFRTTF